jgi:phosphoglycolate phosphatase
MLLRAMDETGVERHMTVMIDDTTYDVLMAGNAGTRAIGVTWGYHDANKLLTAGADAMVARSEDILAVLTNMVEES